MLLRQQTSSSLRKERKNMWNVLIKRYQFSSRKLCLNLHTNVHTNRNVVFVECLKINSLVRSSLYSSIILTRKKIFFFVDADRRRRWNSDVVKMNLFLSQLNSTPYIHLIAYSNDSNDVFDAGKKKDEMKKRERGTATLLSYMLRWMIRHDPADNYSKARRWKKNPEIKSKSWRLQFMHSHFSFII